MRPLGGAILAGALLALATSAAAAEREPPPQALALGGGWFDFKRQRDPAGQFWVEYRAGKGHEPFRPFAVTMVTTDGAIYVGVGIGYELFLGRYLVVTPSLAPGLYAKGGGEDLGLPLEFRSQVEIAYRFRNGSRLGLALSHLSNGSIGKRNPGEESLMLNYEVALKKLFGR